MYTFMKIQHTRSHLLNCFYTNDQDENQNMILYIFTPYFSYIYDTDPFWRALLSSSVTLSERERVNLRLESPPDDMDPTSESALMAWRSRMVW